LYTDLLLKTRYFLVRIIQFLHVNAIKPNIKRVLFLKSQLCTVLVNSASYIITETSASYCSVTVACLVVEISFCSLFIFARCCGVR